MDNIPSYLMLLLIAVFFPGGLTLRTTVIHKVSSMLIGLLLDDNTHVLFFFLFLGGAYWDVVDVFKQTTTCYVR